MDAPLPNERYDEELLDWVRTAIQEGDRVLRSEPMYDEIDKAISYIMGDQIEARRPTSLASVYDNRVKHIVMQQVSALTDIHPLFGFKTMNPKFNAQAEVLNKLTTGWWTNSQADLKLSEILRYATGPGTGYCEVIWDPSASQGQGDIKLVPHDPRDVLPIRPTLNSDLQEWEGVVIRTASSVNALKARFPMKAHRIHASRHGVPDRMYGSARRHSLAMKSPAAQALAGQAKNAVEVIPMTNLYYIYTKDRRLHTGGSPITVGEPDASWSYEVQPAGSKKPDGSRYETDEYRLYPRGRLIICTDTCILYDGPNPYWHGQFPITRLRMDPWPWNLLGVGITRDLCPLQDAMNETANGILDMVRKALKPGLKGDARAMPESMWARINTRVPGQKVRYNPILGNIEYEPPPNIPQYVFDFLKFTVEEMDYHGGVANLNALTQLKQMPGADSIEQMMEALSPTLRMKGRLLEVFLREIGDMVKTNFFQFYNMPRRIALLGEQGIDMQDFEFDPGSMVPAYSQQANPNDYEAAYDYRIPRQKRAQVHHKQFTFQVTPNSLLAISQISRKMMYLRLHREGLMDPWTLYEILEIPNGGSPPSGTKEIPLRIQEATMMGIGVPIPTPGPTPTAQAPPRLEQKPDAGGVPRPVISESG